MKPEIALQIECVKQAQKLGIWCYRVEAEKGHGKSRPPVEPGTPDIDAPGLGRVEMKMPGEPLRPDQVTWHRRAKAQGERVAVCYSVSEFIHTLLLWRKQSRRGCPHERCPMEEQCP